MALSHFFYSIGFRLRIIWLRIMGQLLRQEDNLVSFIPHGGMYDNGYDVFNYKSDNALALLNYMITTYGSRFKYRLACDLRQYSSLKERIKLEYPNVDTDCFPFFQGLNSSFKLHKDLVKSKYIFMSESTPLYFKSKSNRVFFLNYFIPFKNDYGMRVMYKQTYNELFDLSYTTSLLNSYIISTDYELPLRKFRNLGFSRNDELLKPYSCQSLDDDIRKSVNYEVKKVILYTPTHRDYEKKTTKKRGIMGFDIDMRRLEDFLSQNGCVLVCKLHSAQNKEVFEEKIPRGIFVYKSNPFYGLCELMQRSDFLITDYTSAYFDYILLDRPVLFNYYDLDIYEKTRGFSYDPLNAILAGDIFTDEESFYEKMQNVINGSDTFAEKRRFVRDLVHKYTDTFSSKRICNDVFGE
jgi:CDP-glycerol glycerophosphotransferase (TagB/SpsB family)